MIGKNNRERVPRRACYNRLNSEGSYKQSVMKIKVVVHPAEEGGYWAEVPALPGCITEGDNMEELMNNLKDAIQGWLEVAISESNVPYIPC